jgi:hypothetical protein
VKELRLHHGVERREAQGSKEEEELGGAAHRSTTVSEAYQAFLVALLNEDGLMDFLEGSCT